MRLRLALIKAVVPNFISEEDLVSAEAQQDCRPQISIHFSPPRAFDFMLDPRSFAASCKNEKISPDYIYIKNLALVTSSHFTSPLLRSHNLTQLGKDQPVFTVRCLQSPHQLCLISERATSKPEQHL